MTRKMKDSGIEWIGEIPEDWKVAKLKWFANIKSGDALDKNKFIDNGNVEVYGANAKLGYYDKSNIKKKTIITGRVGTLGTLDLKENVWITDNVLAIDVYNADIKFVYYFLHILNFDELSSSTAQPLITATKLLSINIALPINIGQKEISNYLDKKTEQIEEIKSTVIKEIQTLEDYKKSIITEAMTKGLDKNVEMKDSGIEWIGKIPKHWKIVPLKIFSQNYSGGTPSRNKVEYWEDGKIPWVSSGEINKNFIYDTDEHITELGLINSSAKLFPKNTVLVALNGQGKTKGKTAVLKIKATTNQSLTGFVCDEINLHYRFLYYQFISSYKFNRSYYSGGDNRDGIAASNLKTARLSLPNIIEQKQIADYLDQKTKSIDEAIEGKRKQLEALDEYKKSLIYEYVTGKKEVR